MKRVTIPLLSRSRVLRSPEPLVQLAKLSCCFHLAAAHRKLRASIENSHRAE